MTEHIKKSTLSFSANWGPVEICLLLVLASQDWNMSRLVEGPVILAAFSSYNINVLLLSYLLVEPPGYIQIRLSRGDKQKIVLETTQDIPRSSYIHLGFFS